MTRWPFTFGGAAVCAAARDKAKQRAGMNKAFLVRIGLVLYSRLFVVRHVCWIRPQKRPHVCLKARPRGGLDADARRLRRYTALSPTQMADVPHFCLPA